MLKISSEILGGVKIDTPLYICVCVCVCVCVKPKLERVTGN